MAVSPGDQFCNRCGAVMATGTLRFPSSNARVGPATVGPATAVPAVPAVVPVVSGPRRRSRGPSIAVGVAALLTLVFGFLEVWWLMVLLAAVVFVVTYVWWETFAEQIGGPSEQFTKRLVDNLFSFFRMLRVSTASSVRKGRTQLGVRSHQLRVRRQHERALQELGRAVYRGDQAQADTARARAEETEKEIRRYEEQLELARAEADGRVAREKAATDSTQEFR